MPPFAPNKRHPRDFFQLKVFKLLLFTFWEIAVAESGANIEVSRERLAIDPVRRVLLRPIICRLRRILQMINRARPSFVKLVHLRHIVRIQRHGGRVGLSDSIFINHLITSINNLQHFVYFRLIFHYYFHLTALLPLAPYEISLQSENLLFFHTFIKLLG